MLANEVKMLSRFMAGADVEGAEQNAAAEGFATALASLDNTGICVEMMLAKKSMGGGAEGVGMGSATAG